MSIDEKILSVDSDDNNDNYQEFSEFLEEESQRKKNHTAKVIDEFGEQLLKEIDRKKKLEKLRIEKLIPYIIKYGGEIYSVDELKSYTFNDVQDIYNEVKKTNQSFISKFFHFLFNIS